MPAWMHLSWESFQRPDTARRGTFRGRDVRLRCRPLRAAFVPEIALSLAAVACQPAPGRSPDFFDGLLLFHDEAILPNLLHHVIPEYATQMLVLRPGVRGPEYDTSHHRDGDLHSPVRERDCPEGEGSQPCALSDNTSATRDFVRRGTLPRHAPRLSRKPHVSPFTTLFDVLMGTACQIRGRRVALTGASGSFGSAMRDLLERAGAVVVSLKFGVDWTYEDYSGPDSAPEGADILVLAPGAGRASDAGQLRLVPRLDRPFQEPHAKPAGSGGSLGRRVGNRMPSGVWRSQLAVLRPVEAGLCSQGGFLLT